MTVIKFKISDKLFKGYEGDLDLHKFEVLKGEAKKINFHIHDWEFGNILLQGEGTIIWVCNH